MTARRSTGPRRAIRLARRWIRASAANALEVVRLGRLGPAYHAPFDVLEQDPIFRLRRYAPTAGAARATRPVVLVPPLMLTAEIYDVSPELSAAALLAAHGVDVWVVDFGAPEREAGGMRRTLDDHVRATSRAIDRARAVTGSDVHLAGYSQGGMFAYQTAAYRRSEGIASIITFGSPVDIHRSVPRVSSDVVGLLAHAARPFLVSIVERIEGLPGILTSTGFKLLTPKKEIEQLFDFIRKLNDRKALEKRESRRRFLGGEGFVAWPGPALRTFLDEFIVHNRMLSGGMVIDGKTVSLADITCPVLAFVGSRDTFARPDAARAISAAAPRADVHFVSIDAGHFGLVVGSRAVRETWPTVADWARFIDGQGEIPRLVAEPPAHDFEDEPEEAAFDVDVEVDLAIDFLTQVFERAIGRASDWVRDASDSAASLRYQVPRLTELERINSETRVGPSRSLAERARSIPDRTFFLWNGRAFSYADADARVNNVVRGLYECGVRKKDRVVVFMAGRPSFLTAVTALDRLGAVPIVVPPDATESEITEVVAQVGTSHVITDPERAVTARAAFKRKVLVLGGGGRARTLGADVIDMEAIDPAAITLPLDFEADPSRAEDLAAILTIRRGGLALAEITHHRWALSAIGAAAACTLRPDDTVFCCLPLHHPAGLLVSVGSALASGARLALATGFDAATFWSDVRRYGATVVFYAGEMLRPLVDAAPAVHDRHHPIRLFAGSGMRVDLWRRVVERFGAGVLEFYAATTENVVLANASGEKIGAIGRALPGSTELDIVRFDLATRSPILDKQRRFERVGVDEPGIGIARIDPARVDVPAVRDALEPGDAWLVSHDLLRRDADGDIWFVDRIAGMAQAKGGFVSTRRIEDALYRLPEIQLAACIATPELIALVVTAMPLDPARISRALADELALDLRPIRIRKITAMPMTEGFQPDRRALEVAAASFEDEVALDHRNGDYARS